MKQLAFLPHIIMIAIVFSFNLIYAQEGEQATSTPDPIAEEHLQRGNFYFSQGDYEQAIREYALVLQIDANYYDALERSSVIYGILGEYELAFNFADRAVEVGATDAAYDLRGMAHFHLGEYDQAIDDLNQAIELNSEFLDLYYRRGFVYFIKAQLNGTHQDLQRAVEDYTFIINHDPQSLLAYYFRGVANFYLSHHREVIVDLTFFIEHNEEEIADSFLYRGISYHFLRDDESALTDLIYAQGLDPTLSDVYRYLGNIYYTNGEREEALESYQRYVELVGDQADIITIGRINRLENQLSRTPTPVPQ